MSTRILVIEDHPLYAEALLVNIAAAFAGARTMHAASLAEAASIIGAPAAFDLIVTDLCLPDAHGFEALIEMRRLAPATPILVVSAYCDATTMESGAQIGASGFVSKCAGREALTGAMRRLLDGEVLLPRPPVATAANGNGRVAASAAGRLKAMTSQQLRVLQLVCQGLLNKQIAHQLNVSEATIKAHVGEILHKLGVSTRTQAVAEISRAALCQVSAFTSGEPGAARAPERR